MAGEWREDPRLQGRFHPEYPDDVQVVVHDGGPWITDRRPEAVWVRIKKNDGEVFTGEVLNQPDQLATVNQGDEIQFIIPASGEHLLMVRPQYLEERSDWIIRPCDQCGLSELLDPPSELLKKCFPDLPPDAVLEKFTAFCGLCGGVQVIQTASLPEDVPDLPSGSDILRAGVSARRRRPWWQFWR